MVGLAALPARSPGQERMPITRFMFQRWPPALRRKEQTRQPVLAMSSPERAAFLTTTQPFLTASLMRQAAATA